MAYTIVGPNRRIFFFPFAVSKFIIYSHCAPDGLGAAAAAVKNRCKKTIGV